MNISSEQTAERKSEYDRYWNGMLGDRHTHTHSLSKQLHSMQNCQLMFAVHFVMQMNLFDRLESIVF